MSLFRAKGEWWGPCHLVWNLVRVWSVLLVLLILLICVGLAYADQTQPDPKRVKQIQAALVEHGYEPGKNWHETQEILRTIARNHQWQTHRAPDARVLILLGLGNPHSNPDVTLEGHNHLDGVER